MARLPRLYLEGFAQHAIQRGNNRTACFLCEQDHATYLQYLKQSAKKFGVAIHAFVLMSNHVHLLATPMDEFGISKMMQGLGRRYVQYINHSYARTGTLWEGRYKSTVVDSERYLLTVYRYIELNPVRACIVKHASDYPWSSYHHNALGKRIELITPHPQYLSLGKTTPERQAAYKGLFRGRMASEDIKAIRDATNKSWVLGTERFRHMVEQKTLRSAQPRMRGGDRRSSKWRKAQDQRL